MAVVRNLVNLNAVEKGYGSRSVLRDVTLGVSAGDRVGIVGRNGDGKSTLLRLIEGSETPDAGAVTRARGLEQALLGQGDELGRVRDGPRGADRRPRRSMSGPGTPRCGRCSTACSAASSSVASPRDWTQRSRHCRAVSDEGSRSARVLLENPQLLLLDEPTNHLDVDAINWLARHLAARPGSLLVVTHDRWFLDAVCTTTWELAEGRSTSTTAATRRSSSRARNVTVRQRPGRTAAASCCARSSPGYVVGLRRGPRSRSSGSKRRTR